MQRQLKKHSLLAFGLLLGLVSSTPAVSQTYATIDYPGAPASFAVDINDSGQIVGEYLYGNLQRRKGFLLSGGVFTTIVYPRATFTRCIGINRFSDIVGDYILSGSGSSNKHGYLLRNGLFTPIDVPNADETEPNGINATGDIAGWYIDKTGTHGFLLHAGEYTTIDYPGADPFTQVWKVNDAGEIDGRYESKTDGKYHPFTLINRTFTTLPDVPGAVQTTPGNFSETGGLSDAGSIAGHYCSSTPCALFNSVGDIHGFLWSGGVYTTFDYPGAAQTLATGVNSANDVVGLYEDANGGLHGYLRTP